MSAGAYILLFSILFLGCNNKSQFINYGKWKVPEEHNNGYLKGKPKEVETKFYRSNDSIFIDKTEVKSQELFRFDSQGNVIFSRMVVDTFFNVESVFSYSDDGPQYKICSREKGSCNYKTIQTSRRINANSFLLTNYSDGKKRYEELNSFRENNLIRERIFPEGTKRVYTLWYKNERLAKTQIKSDNIVETIYYRDSKGFLDSTVSNNQKEVFVNNEYGDPVFYLLIDGSDTSTIIPLQFKSVHIPTIRMGIGYVVLC